MIVPLPLSTIKRILEATEPGGSANEVTSRRGSGPVASSEKPRPSLPARITDALTKAKKDPRVGVGPLPLADFQTLVAWCRLVKLPDDATEIETALKAAPPE